MGRYLLFFVLLGNTIYCAGIVAFVLPTGLVTGGTTGLGLIVNHYLGIPIELFAAVTIGVGIGMVISQVSEVKGRRFTLHKHMI